MPTPCVDNLSHSLKKARWSAGFLLQRGATRLHAFLLARHAAARGLATHFAGVHAWLHHALLHLHTLHLLSSADVGGVASLDLMGRLRRQRVSRRKCRAGKRRDAR